MKKITLEFFRPVFLLVLIWCFAQPAYAHGDEPRLEISVEMINPGGVVEVRGVDFEPEEAITLMLVNSGTGIPLGETTADIEGIFLQIVEVPVDLPDGTYKLLAITDDHNITSPDLLIQGPPVIAEGEGGQGLRDEDDPLLAPMPTYAPGVVPGGVSQPVAQPPPERTSALLPAVTALLAIILLAAGFLMLRGTRTVQKR